MSITLRPYQIDAINKMRSLMAGGCKSILYQGSTGSGKTMLTAHMLKTCAAKNQRAFFVVHRRELVKQSIQAFSDVGLPYGVISAGWWEEKNKPVQIASIQSLLRRHHRHAKPNLIVWDESHHLAAGSWTKIHAQYSGAYHIGLTATPCRLDGAGLGSYFKEMIQGPSVTQLISQGYLSPYRLYAPSSISTEGVPRIMGDYDKRCIEALADRPTITGSAVEHYRRLAHGKRALVFCVSIQHSQHVAAQFCAAGYRAEHIDGETPVEERDEAMRKFKDGDIQILTSVEIFGEGVDVPALEAVILLRPTQSLGLYLQQVGRGLRPSIGKTEAIILDHVGNVNRHGLPDEERTWTLEMESARKNKKTDGPPVKICPSCMAAQFSGLLSCKFCGFLFEVKAREVKQVEGNLEEVDPEQIRRLRAQEQAGAHDLEALYRIGVQRKYRYARRWAQHVFQARQRQKLGKV